MLVLSRSYPFRKTFLSLDLKKLSILENYNRLQRYKNSLN